MLSRCYLQTPLSELEHFPAPRGSLRLGARILRRQGSERGLAGGFSVTGTNSHPLLLEGTGELAGQAVDEGLLAKLGKLVQKQASPMRTTVTASNYRRQVASALAQRLVKELADAR